MSLRAASSCSRASSLTRGRGGGGRSGRRRARLDEAVERREGFAARERKARALQCANRKDEAASVPARRSPRPRRGRARRRPNRRQRGGTRRGRAGRERRWSFCPEARRPSTAWSRPGERRAHLRVRVPADARWPSRKAQGEMGAAKSQSRRARCREGRLLAAPIARSEPRARSRASAGLPLREQQVAISIASQRIQQRIFGLQFLLPALGVGEQALGALPVRRRRAVRRPGPRGCSHLNSSPTRSAGPQRLFCRLRRGGDLANSSSVSLRVEARTCSEHSSIAAASSHCEAGAHRGQRLLKTPLRAQPETGLAKDPERVATAVSAARAFHMAGRRTRRSPRDRCPAAPNFMCPHRTRLRRLATAGRCGPCRLRPAPPGVARRGSRGRWRDRAARDRRASAFGLRASYRADGHRARLCAAFHAASLVSRSLLAEPFAHQRMGVERFRVGGSSGESSRTSRKRATARRHWSSLRSTSESVSPGIAGLARSALRQSPLAGRSNRPTHAEDRRAGPAVRRAIPSRRTPSRGAHDRGADRRRRREGRGDDRAGARRRSASP